MSNVSRSKGFVPWLALILFVLAAAVALLPNRLLHFLLDLLVSYRLVALALCALTGLAFLIVIARAQNNSLRRAIGSIFFVLACALLVTIGVREWGSYARRGFAFMADGTELRGTLFIPDAARPLPAVVVAHGSPSIPRRLYTVWADVLAREGFAVLTFDKRGTGESGGSYDQNNNASGAVLDRMGRDLAASVEALAHDHRIDPSRISIVGLSPAGWTVPIALQHTRSVNSFVLLSGPTCSTREESAFSTATNEATGPEWEIQRARADNLVKASGPGGFDPRPLLEASAVTGHWIYGSRDASIPVTRSAEILVDLIAKHPGAYSYEIIDGADHLLISRREWLPDFDAQMWRSVLRELRKSRNKHQFNAAYTPSTGVRSAAANR